MSGLQCIIIQQRMKVFQGFLERLVQFVNVSRINPLSIFLHAIVIEYFQRWW